MAEDRFPFAAPGDKSELEEGLAFTPKFGADGLIPAIVTDADGGGVLMFAYMNAEALRLTIETATAHFFSRSRGKLWKKGEESGNLLHIASMRTDCDQDVVWLSARIDGHGAACHTGRKTCFYRNVALGVPAGRADYRLEETVSERAFDPGEVYSRKG
ncbi:MAG: phosphoribosyl-AMP cyclohydrolase [Alphaproteobacteria bacterium]|nr:phosphoribosyl-AMP cyclohydrolase [Alphaproteobacteria bacterium]